MNEGRGGAVGQHQANGSPPMVLRTGPIEIDPQREHVTLDGAALDLPPLSYQLLLALITRAPDTVTKDDLIAAVWGTQGVSDETLAQRVRLLRQALGDQAGAGAGGLLTAVRGRGYRWQPAVERVPRLSVAPAAEPSRSARQVQAHGRRGRIGVVLLAMASALILVSLSWWWSSPPPEAPAVARPASPIVAVLPFEAPDAQSHLALAIEDDLRGRLTALPGLAVRSRAASTRYLAGASVSGSLGAVLSGRLRVDESARVRVAIELIDAASDTLLWTDGFEAPLTVDGVFALQAQIAEQAVQALALEVSPAEAARGGGDRLPTTSIQAYDAYLLGRYHTFRQTPANLARAEADLMRAVRLDPQFAEAWAALGWARTFRGTSYGGQAPQAVYPGAREAAMRALSLQPALADARSLHADILTWYDWDFVAAEAEYRKALELDSYNTLGYALLLSALTRHDEAIALVERRLAVQGDDPYVQVNAAWRYFTAGRLSDAIGAARRGADHPDGATVLGQALLASGAHAEAVEVFEQDLARRGREPVPLANLAIALYVSDQPGRGDALVEELNTIARKRYVSPVLLARVAFRRGRADEGFAYLEQGFAERSRGMIFLRVMRALDGHREDPRYAALVTALGLAQPSS